jgi:hypothetical protein
MSRKHSSPSEHVTDPYQVDVLNPIDTSQPMHFRHIAKQSSTNTRHCISPLHNVFSHSFFSTEPNFDMSERLKPNSIWPTILIQVEGQIVDRNWAKLRGWRLIWSLALRVIKVAFHYGHINQTWLGLLDNVVINYEILGSEDDQTWPLFSFILVSPSLTVNLLPFTY